MPSKHHLFMFKRAHQQQQQQHQHQQPLPQPQEVLREIPFYEEVGMGCYKYLDHLGNGTFGAVSKVKNEEGTFALKTSEARNNSSYKREKRALELSSFIFHGRRNIVLELAKETLDAVWQRNELDEDWARIQRIGKDTAEGLAHLHSFNMVHGGLKPDNILLSDEGVAMLTDLGKCQKGPV
ncbi:Protein kinase, membrane associated tyrosine threonine 1, partial [Mortierella sp. NVP41]